MYNIQQAKKKEKKVSSIYFAGIGIECCSASVSD